MSRLSHKQWSSLHRMSLQIHDCANEDELIQRVVFHFPKTLDINYAVWHELDEQNPNENKAIYVPEEYKHALKSVQDRFIPNLASHPIVSGLGIGSDFIFPKNKVYSMDDFASRSQIKETPIMKEFYSHLDCKDNSCIQMTDPKHANVFMCFNTTSKFTSEQKLSLQVIREHVSLAFKNFRRNDSLTERYRESMPMLDYNSLTKREKEVLPYLLYGKTNQEIAIILGISKRTVEKHVATIIDKAGVENRKVLISAFRFYKNDSK